MKNYSAIIFFLVCFGMQHIMGFSGNTISGKVYDAESQEALIGATIQLLDFDLGTVTDLDGSFKLDAPQAASYRITFSYIGFVTDTLIVDYSNTKNISIALQEGVELEEVVISDKYSKAKDNYQKTRMSFVDLDPETVKLLPALLSENDVLKAIQLLPGIQSTEGASTGYYVRGGGSDQNLILLNDATIYNPFHAAGFISIFNGDVVDRIDMYKGGFPSQYGGRLSSLLSVQSKTPSFQKASGNVGIGLVTAKATFELPIVKNKLSILMSGRGFYSYSLFRAFASADLKKDLPKYYFYDMHGQVDWKPSEKDHVSLFYYSGKDQVAFQDKSTKDSTKFDIPWSNSVAGGSWKRQISDDLIITTSAYQSKYDFFFGADYTYGGQNLTTEIKEIGGRVNLSHKVNQHYLNYGVQGNYSSITPEIKKYDIDRSNLNNTRVADIQKSYQPINVNLYLNDDWSVTEKFGINYGVRLGIFREQTKTFYNVDPKVVLRYNLSKSSSVKASYNYSTQYLHLLASSTTTSPLDLWISSNEKVAPQRAHSVSLGWYQNLKNNTYEISVEGYFRKLNNQIEYKEGVDVFAGDNFSDKLLFGQGRSGGLEFLIRKRAGKVTGFVGYTLAWAKRQFDDLNQGEWYNFKFDRRHDFTASINYNINERWSISALFVVGTGNTLTIPSTEFYTPKNQGYGNYFVDYNNRNSYRLSANHRLDLSVTYKSKPKRVQSIFKLDIYNVYSRKNPFFVILTSDGQGRRQPNKHTLREYALLPIIPSFSYQMEF